MKSFLKILFLLLSVSIFMYASEGQVILKVDKPGFVPVDSVYQFSLLLSNKIHQVEKVNFYIFLDDGIEVESIKYSGRDYQTELLCQPAVHPGYYGKTIKAEFSDYDSSYFSGSNSQLIVNVLAKYIEKTEVAFAFEFIEADSVVEEYSSFDSNREESLPILGVDFYIPQSYAGKCLQMKNESSYVLDYDYVISNSRLLIGFWAKLSSVRQKLLNIINTQYTDTLFNIEIGINQELVIPHDADDVNLSNLFVADKSWNYYSVIFDFDYNEIIFGLNGETSFTYRRSLNRNEIFTLELLNNSGQNIQIDNLGVYDFGGRLSRIKKNLNYDKVISDSSKQIYFESFDNIADEDLQLNRSDDFVFSELKAVESDAPIFTRLPELYVRSFENFNEVIWQNSDDSVVDYYILEKSLNGIDYTEVGSKGSDSDPEKEYSMIDQRNSLDEIVYYRIKLINDDESVLYSPTLKLGQAQQENFHIEQNYPNPFNPLTTTTVEVLASDNFSVIVYDLVGNKIATIYDGMLEKGIHKFDFDGSQLPSGIYFLEVSSRSFTQAIKMILAK